MTTLVSSVFILSLFGSMIYALLYLRQVRKLIDKLEAEYYEIWDKLGRPKLGVESDIKSSMNLLKFVLRKQYIIGKNELFIIGSSARFRFLLFIGFFAVVLIALFARNLL